MGVLIYPAYRRGFFIRKDLESTWSNFQWKVSCPEYIAGWFGSLESAYRWIYKGEDF